MKLHDAFSLLDLVKIKIEELRLQQSLTPAVQEVRFFKVESFSENLDSYIVAFNNNADASLGMDANLVIHNILTSLEIATAQLHREFGLSDSGCHFHIEESKDIYRKRLWSQVKLPENFKILMELFQELNPDPKLMHQCKKHDTMRKHRLLLPIAKTVVSNSPIKLPYFMENFMKANLGFGLDNMKMPWQSGGRIHLRKGLDPRASFKPTGKTEYVFPNESPLRGRNVISTCDQFYLRARAIIATLNHELEHPGEISSQAHRGIEIRFDP